MKRAPVINIVQNNYKVHEYSTIGHAPAVFDKGYCNYKNFGTFCEKGIFFVTRLKENAQYAVIESRLTDSPLIPTDETIFFTGKRQKRAALIN